MDKIIEVAEAIALSIYGGYPVSMKERESWYPWKFCLTAAEAAIKAAEKHDARVADSGPYSGALRSMTFAERDKLRDDTVGGGSGKIGFLGL